MKTNVSYYDFRDAFAAYDRIDQYTREGLEMLYNFLIEMEQDTGEELELDVIAICCDFSEETWSEIADNYSIDLSDCDDDDDKKQAVIEHLEYNTLYVGETEADTLIYVAFQPISLTALDISAVYDVY